MKDYYNIRQKYGRHTVYHGLRSHPLILEWLHILNTKYDKLDDKEILNLEVEIGNWIKGDMHWRNTYKTTYDPVTQCITVEGFEKYGYPNYFKINMAQLEFLLHRMRYNKATVYMNHQSVVKIVICKVDDYDIDTKKVFKKQIRDGFDDGNDCNVLTPHNPREWKGGRPKCP